MANTYAKHEATNWPIPNYWDVVALLLIVGLLALFAWGAKSMLGSYHLGESMVISLKPSMLPYYALRTVMRMFVALFCSLVFTFVVGTWAARSRHAERIIVPFIDIMQSVPVLGFLPVGMVVFVALFKGSMLGPESAAIFAIFTAQVWNMTLSFYQSISTVPNELKEAGRMFQMNQWQIFWRIEVPFALPGLLWNMMMSMSSSWVFLVAAEAITVAHHQVLLPGIGSYIDMAISTQNVHAIIYVIITMLLVIAVYDQVLFRPLLAWAEKFKVSDSIDAEESESWLLNLFQRARFIRQFGRFLSYFGGWFVNMSLMAKAPKRKTYQPKKWQRHTLVLFSYALLITVLSAASIMVYRFIFASLPLSATGDALWAGLATALRVFVVIILSSLIWVPFGVMIGLHPKASKIVQPIVQFCAAFPANLLFPVMVLLIVTYHLNVNIWSTPLMMLGTMWYVLFNVIAGTNALPKQMHFAVRTLNIHGWLWWRRFILPGIFPYYITGAITAAGGAWNFSIIAEVLSWGQHQFYAEGLGAYITKAYTMGNFPKLALGVVVMSLFVVVINRLVWRPLYRLAEEKFRLT